MDEAARTYLHGSARAFEPGDVLSGRGEAYARDWTGTGFYAALELWRPEGCLAQRDAVFLVGEPDDLDLAGGSSAWTLEVEPLGPVSRHDLNWTGEILALLEAGHAPDGPRVAAAARAYWGGEPSPDERLWEYLAAGVRVLSCRPGDEPAGPALGG